jgi:hypothetical protein
MSDDKELVRKNSDVPSTTPPRQPAYPAEARQGGAAAPGAPQDANTIDYREIGATGLRRFSGFIYEEFLPELTGWQGIQVYTEMKKNDATVGAILNAIKILCRKVKWFADPASQEPDDLVAAEFLETCLNDMSQTWIDTVDEILSMLEYGYAPHEIVYKRRCGDVLDPSMRSKYSDGRIGWRKLPIRSQDTIYRWDFDDHGGIRGVEQLAPPHYYHVVIPVEKLLLFRTTIAKNNPEGQSILRTAYRSWYVKKNIENIEAIGVERDLAGLPMAFVPSELLSRNASIDQKNLLAAIRDIVVNVRRNAQEGMVFPQAYDQVSGKPLYDFKLLSTGGARQFDTTAVINRYDQRIAMTCLADFLLLGMDKVGSFALSSVKTNLFSTAIGAYLDIICDVMNRFAIPRLFALNPDMEISDYPKIKHGDLGAVDLNELGSYIQKLSQSGMPLFPNNELEKHLMEIAGMPVGAMADPEKPNFEVDTSARADRPPVEIPASDKQMPTEGGISDRTPVDGAPKPATVVTNASGDTETNSGRRP